MDNLTRKEGRENANKKVEDFKKNMKVSLSAMAKTNAGLMVLRFLMYESCFLSPLMYETPEGVNTDVMIANEAKRRQYLTLRGYMDRETIVRVELPDQVTDKQGGTQ